MYLVKYIWRDAPAYLVIFNFFSLNSNFVQFFNEFTMYAVLIFMQL